jgi:hypothetical protein
MLKVRFEDRQIKTYLLMSSFNMSFANELINNLFPTGAARNNPFIIEKLERNQKQKTDYKRWLETSEAKIFNETIHLAYQRIKHNTQQASEIVLLQSQYAQTMLIPCQNGLERLVFQHYFDFIKDRIMSIGYHTNLAEREINDKETHIETTERYYLNFPDEIRAGGRIHQLYGNLLAELKYVDDKPSFVSITATYQTDEKKYFPAMSFDELTDFLFFNYSLRNW